MISYLCARRWLKQVNKTGTNEQFRHYWYKVLGNSQRKVRCYYAMCSILTTTLQAYKTECNQLVSLRGKHFVWSDVRE